MNSKLLTAFLAFLMGLNTALLIVILIRVEQTPAVQPPAAAMGAATTTAGTQMITLPSFEDESLALSGSQRTQIARIKERWAREEQSRQLRATSRMGQMPEVLMGEDLSMEAVQPLMDEAHEDSRKRMETMMGLYREYQDVLTPEQKREFRRMLEERHRMMREGRRHMGGERNRGNNRNRSDLMERGDRQGRQRPMMNPPGEPGQNFRDQPRPEQPRDRY